VRYNCCFLKNRFPSVRLVTTLDCLLLAAITAWMILPLFHLDYMDRWISMESTYIGDARFLAEHWPHPRWQPDWYGGARFDYFFPPVMRYATAMTVRTFSMLPARAYHLCCAMFYCLGIVSVYLLIRVARRSRMAAWAGALCTLLVSPVLLLIPRLYVAGWHRAPQRIVLLTQWGEGPHMAALAMLPLALACTWLAFERHRPAALAGAGFFSAAVLSSDYYGATALLLFFFILLWSFWITHQETAVFGRAAAIVVLTWGLTAVWLVPSTLRVTLQNLNLVSQPSTTWSIWILLAVVVGYLLVSDRFARGRREHVWTVFVTGCLPIFGVYVLANEYSTFRIAGDPSRLVPELELALVLAAAGLISWPAHRAGKAAVVTIAVLVLASAAPYIRRHNVLFPRDAQFEQRPEYQLQEWIRAHMPGARAFVAGSVRLWYDTWHDLAQLCGGSDVGINNGIVVAAQWQVLLSDNADVSVEWMRALGVDAIVVNGKDSKEMYHDFQHPEKFAGKLPVLIDNHQGDAIYGVTRRFPGIARVVDRARLDAIPPFGREPDIEKLRAYDAVVEQGPDAPATVEWQSSDSFRAHATLQPGQALLVQQSWDPAWRASSAAGTVALRRDPMGFIVADSPAGEQDIAFTFTLPFENAAGRAITLAALAALVGLCIRGYAARH
jgi:hypothetical protein